MKFFARLVDWSLHAILFHNGQQEPLRYHAASKHTTTAGKDLDLAKALTDSSTECVHGPKSRRCWSSGFDIATDYEHHWPDTRVTRQVRT